MTLEEKAKEKLKELDKATLPLSTLPKGFTTDHIYFAAQNFLEMKKYEIVIDLCDAMLKHL